MALIALQNVSVEYSSVGAPTTSVLRELNFEVAEQSSVAVVGPSGSGKSTLLYVMGGLLPPSSGQVLFGGTALGALSEKERAQFRNERMGFVFQNHHLLPQCTAVENVLVPRLVHPRRGPEDRARAEELLEAVGLGHRLQHRPGQLSGGERQRVAVARALINEPDLLLADEPTGSLDHESAAGLADLLQQFNQTQRLTLVVVTHSLELAHRMGQQVELRNGQLQERPPVAS